MKGKFRTVMAYVGDCGCDRVNFWSNPAMSYSGLPTGTATTAYNALTLNNTRGTIANYRAGRDGGGGGGGGTGLPESDHPSPMGSIKRGPTLRREIRLRSWSRLIREPRLRPVTISCTFPMSSNRAVTGSPFSGSALSGRSVQVAGSTVRLRLVTDSAVNDFGFKVTSRMAANGDPVVCRALR